MSASRQRCLAAAGLRADAAGLVTDTLVAAELRGVASHGTVRLPIYVARLEHGLRGREPNPAVERQRGAITLIDARHAPGQVAAMFAVDLAVTLAREHGVGLNPVRHRNHSGVGGGRRGLPHGRRPRGARRGAAGRVEGIRSRTDGRTAVRAIGWGRHGHQR